MNVGDTYVRRDKKWTGIASHLFIIATRGRGNRQEWYVMWRSPDSGRPQGGWFSKGGVSEATWEPWQPPSF